MSHQIAQVNIARLVAPMDSEQLADFAAGLDPINALAEASPGFVWRFQDEHGNATEVRPYDDDQIIINLTVWESVEALHGFTYRSDHRAFLPRRREFFTPAPGAAIALWWVPAGHRPDPTEAKARLDHLTEHGPTPEAFTFRQRFPAPTA
ncbi:DUF3291 domain-containing protein [soil metagenome]